MSRLIVWMISTSLIFPVIAAAKEKSPPSFARTSNWEINYDEDSCHLMAKFGEGKRSTVIRLTRYQPESGFDIIFYGASLETYEPKIKVKIGYGLAPPIQFDALTGHTEDKEPLVVVTGQRLDNWVRHSPDETPPVVSVAQEEQANRIDLAIPGGRQYRLETGSFGKPMAAMRTCITDLVRKWGYDPAQQAALKTRPTPLNDPRSWLVNGDFPIGATGRNGLVQFRLDIDGNGKVVGCYILHRTNPDKFADLTCKLLSKRAKFTPALDQSGQPTRSYFISKVHWLTFGN